MSTDTQISETEVSWPVDGIEVHATLTRPAGAGPFPAAIFVAGSGPTDRNWNSPAIPGSNGSGAQLARALAGAGFLTLRYDKRASGPRVAENIHRLAGKISMQGHMDELAGGVRLLAARPEVDQARIFVLTNSEGAVHGLNYQTGKPGVPLAGMVLTSPPGRVMGELAHSQIAAQLTLLPGGETMLAAYDRAMAQFVAGQPVLIDEILPTEMKQVIQAITQPINQPFSGELWMYNPIAALEKVRIPVLIVIGKKDIQVDWQVDGPNFAAAVQDYPNIQIAYMETANHVLKYEPKPRSELTPAHAMATYSAEGLELDAETVATIVSWLRGRIS